MREEEEEESRVPYSRLGSLRSRGWLSGRRSPASGLLSLLTAVVIAAALADDDWLCLSGGGCQLDHIGVTLFYQSASFRRLLSDDSLSRPPPLSPLRLRRQHWHFEVDGRNYLDCATPALSDIFHAVMALSFVLLLTSIAALALEIAAPRKGFPAWLRRNAIFPVFSVALAVLALAGGWLAAERLQELQEDTVPSLHPRRPVWVAYSDGLYLVLAGGLLSLAAAAASLLASGRWAAAEELRRSTTEEERRRSESARGEPPVPGSTGPPPPLHLLLALPPPPSYSAPFHSPIQTDHSDSLPL